MTKYEKRKLCSGCTENFYNGNNPLGVSECWHFSDAIVVHRAFIGLSWVPPWNASIERTLSCHRKNGYVSVGPSHPQLVKGKKRP